MLVVYSATLPDHASGVLAPSGLSTPHGTARLVARTSDGWRPIREAATGQTALFRPSRGGDIDLVYEVDPDLQADYPDEMFAHRDTRFTRFADALTAEVAGSCAGLGGLDRARAIACHTAERFTYGHPEKTLGAGEEAVPALGCGLTEGSCVDINMYFIAALRSAGIEAGYVTGFFFPEERAGTCTDGHCWVVSRIDGQCQEWDIAHHLKLGTRRIAPGLNPKPGRRVACFHSMGLDFPEIGIAELKAIIEPLALVGGALAAFDAPRIRLHTAAGVH